MTRLRLITDPRCLEHRVPAGFPEVPERLRGILDGVRGVTIDREAAAGRQTAAEAAVARAHAAGYVERFRRAVERGDGLLDSADNPLGAGTWPAAWGAVAATLEAVEWSMGEEGRSGFAAVRPPGHHAEHALAMGFCYLNNVAAAAEHLLAEHRLERVAVVDFDVHHGNGTQQIFYERAEVLYASLHRYPFYPGTGAAAERGRGGGLGSTLNLPMAAGCGDAEYREVFEEALLPGLERFAPQALLVSAGFDAWRDDPLGGMRVSEDGYAEWGRLLGEAARRLCGRRLASVLEGGYDLDALPDLVTAYLAGVAAGLG